MTTVADRLRRDALAISRKALRRGDLATAERAMRLAERYFAHSEYVWAVEGLRLRKRRLAAARALREEDEAEPLKAPRAPRSS